MFCVETRGAHGGQARRVPDGMCRRPEGSDPRPPSPQEGLSEEDLYGPPRADAAAPREPSDTLPRAVFQVAREAAPPAPLQWQRGNGNGTSGGWS